MKRIVYPQLKRMLDDGESEVTLRAHLRYLARIHRVRWIKLFRRGRRFSIRIRVNPEDEILDGVSVNIQELLVALDDIALELRRRYTPSYVKEIEGSRRMSRPVMNNDTRRREGEKWANDAPEKHRPRRHHFNVPVKAAMVDVLEVMSRQHPRRPGMFEEWSFGDASIFKQFGKNVPGSTGNRLVGLEVPSSERSFGGSPYASWGDFDKTSAGYRGGDVTRWREIVGLPGASASRGTLARELARSGVESEVVEAIVGALKTRKIPEGARGSAIFEVAMILFTQEAHRNPRALLHNMMMLDRLSGHATEDTGERAQKWLEAFGQHPMGPKGAMKRTRALDEAMAGWRGEIEAGRTPADPKAYNRGPGGGADAERAMWMEYNSIKAWVRAMDWDFDDLSSEREKREELVQTIRTRMMARARALNLI
ncbi:hypothetical protein FIV42_16435 [Persicimonas caeni]|uniref:Uncharacterized protein n=1 Tax=Persicimonas caeni TaxID=2292766 RepID=A0A4Y6PW83_PERCE|nr:hypothetical protein [Persicimonas caeni]QDG52267.1 hypothetical protein FIV42_16435 [Persicimonas caeni]QED33489.1 hypothetical protein FRD00_16430 [Persicimonas caeni]